MNVISLALQGPSVALVRNSVTGAPEDIGYSYNHPLQARGPTSEYNLCQSNNTKTQIKTTLHNTINFR